MKIYIVKEHQDYEGSYIIGVFTNKEKAIELYDSKLTTLITAIELVEAKADEIPYIEKSLNYKS